MNKADIEGLLKDVTLANLARALCSGVREVHEADTETLKRVFEEYGACKYQGVPIPGGKEISGLGLREAAKALGALLMVIFEDDGHRQHEFNDDVKAAAVAASIVADLRSCVGEAEHRARRWKDEARKNDRWKGTEFPVRMQLRDLTITVDRAVKPAEEDVHELRQVEVHKVKGRGTMFIVDPEHEKAVFRQNMRLRWGGDEYILRGIESGGGSKKICLLVRKLEKEAGDEEGSV